MFGGAALSTIYNTDSVLLSTTPIRTVRLALRSATDNITSGLLRLISSTHRYGIRAFDTSVYYGDSEIVLGNVLKALESKFPRSSYQLVKTHGTHVNSILFVTDATHR